MCKSKYEFGYQYYTWLELAAIAACTLGLGVCIAAILVHAGVFDAR